MKKKILIVSLIGIMMLTFTGCASWNRAMKSFGSDVTGGLNRTVIVYSLSGVELNRYEGKIDVQESDNKVLFDLNGKRTTIYNATVVVQEQ